MCRYSSLSSIMSSVPSHRDILVNGLDNWMMSQEERFRSDSKLLRELAEDAYDTCVSAIDALHALLREHDEESDSVASVKSECYCGTPHPDWTQRLDGQKAVVATVAEASDHDCGAAHEAPAAPAPVTEPQSDADHYFRGIGYPEGQIVSMRQVWQAYHISKAAGRAKELEIGSWATLPNKKRIMIFKGHAFQPPTDRLYYVPGPLKHLGLYDRGGARVVPSDEVPAIPQTRDHYPWWKPAANRVPA